MVDSIGDSDAHEWGSPPRNLRCYSDPLSQTKEGDPQQGLSQEVPGHSHQRFPYRDVGDHARTWVLGRNLPLNIVPFGRPV
jgi:hypothetical protein